MWIEKISEVLNDMVPVFFLAIALLALMRIVKKSCAPVKSVKAELCEKYSYETVSQHQVASRVYVLVFEADGKRLSFNVSEFSYGGYKVKKKGTLKYKGDRLISFR